MHGVISLFTDRHGFGSKRATKNFLKQVDVIKPDAIGLHNIHGYYLNVKILFKYIKEKNIPVLWTFHDCWPFTGHCSYNTDCDNCKNCQRKYPTSIFLNQDNRNFKDKKLIFNQSKKTANNNTLFVVERFSAAIFFKISSCSASITASI